MSVWNGCPASFTAWRSPSQPRHLRGCRGLVNEDEPLRIEIKLAVEPSYAAAQDIRTLLL